MCYYLNYSKILGGFRAFSARTQSRSNKSRLVQA
jgi:hypothetical protein